MSFVTRSKRAPRVSVLVGAIGCQVRVGRPLTKPLEEVEHPETRLIFRNISGLLADWERREWAALPPRCSTPGVCAPRSWRFCFGRQIRSRTTDNHSGGKV